MRDIADELDWNRTMIDNFRAHGGQITAGRLAGRSLLLLTTVGAKSGTWRTTPVGYHRDGDRLVIVGSNSGGPKDAGWYHNVLADPIVTVEVGTERFRARATVAQGDERRRLFDDHVAASPIFADYQRMTGRQLPVVVLERLAG